MSFNHLILGDTLKQNEILHEDTMLQSSSKCYAAIMQ